MDLSLILINGLTWLEDLINKPYLITNKLKNNSPDLIAFYNGMFQSITETFNDEG
jgi:hypothetical protein